MKKNSLLFLFLLYFSLDSMAQTVAFEYDSMGSQINRTYNSSGSRLSQQQPKDYKDLVANDFQKFFSEDIISYYPNPVKDELFLKWEVLNDNVVDNITIYNINGTLVKEIKFIKENETIISFQNFNSGTFLVNLNFTSGEQKSITVIKN